MQLETYSSMITWWNKDEHKLFILEQKNRESRPNKEVSTKEIKHKHYIIGINTTSVSTLGGPLLKRELQTSEEKRSLFIDF